MVTPDDRQAAQQRRIIDASVHVFFESNGDLRSYMQEPFKSRGIPDVEMDWCGAPGGEYVPWAERPGMYPGSDPEFAGEQLFGERGVDLAILHPMTRGCGPDRHLVSAMLAAAGLCHAPTLADSGTPLICGNGQAYSPADVVVLAQIEVL